MGKYYVNIENINPSERGGLLLQIIADALLNSVSKTIVSDALSLLASDIQAYVDAKGKVELETVIDLIEKRKRELNLEDKPL